MASNSQPPPVNIPISLLKNPQEAVYWKSQNNALYQLWNLAQDIPGLVTPYPVVDGGTGATTAAGVRANFSLYSVTEIDTLIEDTKRYALLVS